MSLLKIFWSNWFKSNFVKGYILCSIFLILIANFYIVSFEKDLIYRLGGSFKIPYVFNLLFAMNYPFVFLFPLLMGYVSGIKDQSGSFLRYILLSGFSKKQLFIFFQKNLLIANSILTILVFFSALVLGFIEGVSPKRTTIQDFIWPFLYFFQGFAIGNYFLLILLLSRSLLKTILITFFFAFLLEPLLVYTSKEAFDLFSYLPFRSINNLTFVQGMDFTISDTPSRSLNLLLATLYLFLSFFLNLRLFKRLSV